MMYYWKVIQTLHMIENNRINFDSLKPNLSHT